MPFAPQPRKKGAQRPQDGKTPSCGHTASIANCPECKAEAARAAQENKAKTLALRDKIVEKLSRNSKLAEKAAFVLSRWINEKKK